MISVAEAHQIVLFHCADFGTECVSLDQAIGRVLREDWHADRDMPPYDRVTMDGIAVHYNSAVTTGKLTIEGIAAAGDPKKSLQNSSACLEVMTGSILPDGTDTVIRYEDLNINQDVASVQTQYRKGQNIHRKGEDRKKGDLLCQSGIVLSAAEIGVGATIGKSEVLVSRFPKTLIISTGDELVEVNEAPLDHQIRKSNVYRLAGTLQSRGMQVDTAHLLDDYQEIIAKLEGQLAKYDLIILSGGVSKGKFDFLPDALNELGVQKHFHRIAQRPGKPFWFGSHPNGCTVFAMPGNPVSSFMCTHIYLMDWLDRCLKITADDQHYASLSADVSFKPDLTYFLEVKISCNTNGQLIATPQKGHGSGDLANLMNGDAFIRLPRGKEIFTRGEVYPIIYYR